MEKELEFRFSMLSENDSWWAKAEMRTNKKTMEEGPRGEGSEKNAFSPRPLPHCFLFQPPFTFCAAVTLSKHNKYRQLRRLASPHVGMLE